MKIIKNIFIFFLELLLIIVEIGIGFTVATKILLSKKEEPKEQPTVNTEIKEPNPIIETAPEEEKKNDILNKVGKIEITEKEVNIILNDSKFKKSVNDFITSTALHQFDDTYEIKYPSEDAITDAIYDNFDQLKESLNIDIKKDEISRNDIYREVCRNYGKMKEKMQEYIKKIGG